MAIRNIREDGDEILRKKSRKVEVIDEKIKTLVNVTESRNKKRALIIRNSNLINNTSYKTSKDLNHTQNILNKYIHPHSSSISIEDYKGRYYSPSKPLEGEINFSEFHNFSNISKIRLEKYNSSKIVNNIDAEKIDFIQNDIKNINKNNFNQIKSNESIK